MELPSPKNKKVFKGIFRARKTKTSYISLKKFFLHLLTTADQGIKDKKSVLQDKY